MKSPIFNPPKCLWVVFRQILLSPIFRLIRYDINSHMSFIIKCETSWLFLCFLLFYSSKKPEQIVNMPDLMLILYYSFWNFPKFMNNRPLHLLSIYHSHFNSVIAKCGQNLSNFQFSMNCKNFPDKCLVEHWVSLTLRRSETVKVFPTFGLNPRSEPWNFSVA